MYYIWGSNTPKDNDPLKEEKKKWLDDIQKLKDKYESIKIDKYDLPIKAITKEIIKDQIKDQIKVLLIGYCSHFKVDLNSFLT